MDEEMIRRIRPKLVWVAKEVLRNEADAEDVAQATLVLLVKHANSVEFPVAWSLTVAYRVAVKLRKERAREMVSSELTDEAADRVGVLDLATVLAQQLFVADLLASLSDQRRKALEWRYLQDLPVEAVARLLGTNNISTAKSTLYQALRAARTSDMWAEERVSNDD